MLYRCFHGLSPAIRQLLLDDVLPSRSTGTRGRKPKLSVLQSLVLHFEDREKWVSRSGKGFQAEEKGLRLLGDMQSAFKKLVESTWELGEPSDPHVPTSPRYGTAESVLGKIFSVSLTLVYF